jgi:creatinine amidohydrolase/Fe(II)-dependent formamide hydrolase-like protein
MLALAPHLVRRELVASAGQTADKDAISAMIFDPGVSFPWRTDDERLAANGVIGEAHAASPELGWAIVDSVIAQTRGVLQRLLENQRRTLRSGGFRQG